MERKVYPAITIKAEGDQGIVEHIIAVMGNIDQGGDRIHNGAFTKTITERGGKVRVIDNHNYDSVLRVIGKPIELREISKDELPASLVSEFPDATGALKATTQYLMDTPEGEGAFKRIKAGAVNEYSFGYDVMDFDYEALDENGDDKRWVEMEGETIRNLRTLKLYEYGPVIWGMNEATTTLGVKADDEDEDAGDEDPPAGPEIKNYYLLEIALAQALIEKYPELGEDLLLIEDSETQEQDEDLDEDPDVDQAADESTVEQDTDDEAGPGQDDGDPPTSDEMIQLIDIEIEDIELLEV